MAGKDTTSPESFVFHNKGNPIRAFNYKVWHRACAKIGLDISAKRKRFVPHSSRTCFYGRCDEAAIQPHVAREMIGHKSSSMEDRYRAIKKEQVKKGFVKLGLAEKSYEKKA